MSSLSLGGNKGVRVGAGGISQEAAANPPAPASVAGPGWGRRAKSEWVCANGGFRSLVEAVRLLSSSPPWCQPPVPGQLPL